MSGMLDFGTGDSEEKVIIVGLGMLEEVGLVLEEVGVVEKVEWEEVDWDLIEADVLVDGEEAVVDVLEEVRYLG